MKLSKNLILGSNSPRRKEILESAGFDFTVMVRETDESFGSEIEIEKVPELLAYKKASCFKEFGQETIIICADTVVVCDNQILNKPLSFNEAFEMLSNLSNKTHKVITAVSIKMGVNYTNFIDEALVHFDKLEPIEIEYYIKKHKPFDKAGAYGVQDFIGMVGISKIEGSFYTVMGLPIHKVYKFLKPFVML